MSQHSISNFSRKLLILFWFSMIFTVVLNTVFWFGATMFDAEWFHATFPIEVALPLSVTRSIIGYFPSMISTLLTVLYCGSSSSFSVCMRKGRFLNAKIRSVSRNSATY